MGRVELVVFLWWGEWILCGGWGATALALGDWVLLVWHTARVGGANCHCPRATQTQSLTPYKLPLKIPSTKSTPQTQAADFFAGHELSRAG